MHTGNQKISNTLCELLLLKILWGKGEATSNIKEKSHTLFFFNFYFIFKLYIIVLVLPNPILLTADLSAETLQARREWEDMFKVLKGKKIYNQDYCAQQGSH